MDRTNAVAIVGIGLRFPRCGSVAEFWRRLRRGEDCIVELTDEELLAAGAAPTDLADPRYVRRVSRLEGVDQFDHDFFGLTLRDARIADPQLRILLEVAHECAESSGHVLAGTRTGVYFGTAPSDFWLPRVIYQHPDRIGASVGRRIYAKSNYAAMQVAHKMNLHGPAVCLSTACSSALVAVHEAYNHLLLYDCDYAIAGGGCVGSDVGYVYQEGGIDSPDGYCRTFDRRAGGTLFGSGVGVVLLRRWEDARRDGDHVYALIRAVGVNNDGRDKPGFTAPSAAGQADLIAETMERARTKPEWISYVEAHGTGTPVGDPIEVEALTRAFRRNGAVRRQYCALGSVKTNVGHLNEAAGIAGVIKVALALHHREIPAHLNYTEPNESIDFDESPFFVNTELREWANGDRPRFASVSAFGIGGTNAHAVLEEAPDLPAVRRTRSHHLLVCSAKSADALEAGVQRLTSHLESASTESLANIAYTMQVGRTAFRHRAFAVADGTTDAPRLLGGWSRPVEASDPPPRVAFTFPGQGSQHAGMGRGLYERIPRFRSAVDECADVLREPLGMDIRTALFADKADGDPLRETRLAQPVLFTICHSLATVLQAWGVQPHVMLGHSIGEYVAATISGVMSREDALRLIATRGRLMQALPPGAMLSVPLSESQTQAWVGDDVYVAVVNGPERSVLAGSDRAIQRAEEELARRGVRCKRLRTSHAFHSPMMDPVLQDFGEVVHAVELRPPEIPFFSNVTGRPIEAGEATDPEYWVRHLRSTVRFADGMAGLAAAADLFLEVGPGSELTTLARESDWTAVPSLPGRGRSDGDDVEVLRGLGRLWELGCPLDFEALHEGEPRRRVPLPTYAFQRTSHWVEAPEAAESASSTVHPLIGRRWVDSPSTDAYEGRISERDHGYVWDHRVLESVIFPGAAYAEMALGAARQHLAAGGLRIKEISFERPLIFTSPRGRRLQTVLTKEDSGARFEILSRSEGASPTTEGKWLVYARGEVERAESQTPPPRIALNDLRARITNEVAPEAFYANTGFVRYGPSFRAIRGLWRGGAEALARVSLPASCAASAGRYTFHPVLLDACLQAAGALRHDDDDGPPTLPAGLSDVTVYSDVPSTFWVYARALDVPGKASSAEFVVLGEEGQVWCRVGEYRQEPVDTGDVEGAHPSEPTLLRIAWKEAGSVPDPVPSGGSWLVLRGLAPESREAAQWLERGLRERTEGRTGARRTADVRVVGLGQSLSEGVAGWAATRDSGRRDVITCVPMEPRLGAVDLCEHVVSLVQALSEVDWTVTPRLWVLTRGGQSVRGSGLESDDEVAQASVWGLVNTIHVEHPEFRCSLLDLDPDDPDPSAVLDELIAADVEDRLAWRRGSRLVPRLRAIAGVDDGTGAGWLTRPTGGYALRIREFGSFDNLELAGRPRRRREIGRDSVEVSLKAGGLNFKECLLALGRLEQGANAADFRSGFEGSGVVSRVGGDVEDLSVGDEVIVWANGCLASDIVVPRAQVVRKPPGIGSDEAAGLPTVFMTAQHALCEIAGVRRGDRVLIHSCAGGVGQAALQIARAAGAEIFATASESKFEFLRAQGVRHVANSRTGAFGREIRELTGGEGVDVVLNSLSGEAIRESFDVLAEGGRFVEIGKVGIWTEAEAAAHRPDVTYEAFELGVGSAGGDGVMQRLMPPVLEGLERGTLRPVVTRIFPVEQARAAFRWLASGRSVGKVVLRLDGAESAAARFEPRPDGAYLITGGLGALGLRVAEWLAARGAKRLTLMSRRSPTGSTSSRIGRLREMGAQVEVAAVDVSRLEDVAEVVRASSPVAGVFHCAGTLDDGILLRQNRSRFEQIMRPKVIGTEVLHAATAEQDLDLFVCFSSTSALFDGGGQANYAAANAFMDGFVHRRRALGLPGLSINWGAWSGGGMAASIRDGAGDRLITPAEGVTALERVLSLHEPQVVVAKVAHHLTSGAPISRLLAELESPDSPRRRTDYEAIRASRPHLDRVEALREFLRIQVGKVLGVGGDEVGIEDNFVDVGIDSLMIVELRNNVREGTGVPIPAGVIFAHPTVGNLTSFLSAELFGESGAAEPVDPGLRAAPAVAGLVTLSERGGGRPVFGFPGVGDNVRDFDEFAGAYGAGPVHVLYDAAPDAERSGAEGLRQLSAEYAERIGQTSDGPYSLVGYSFGGCVAVEVAHQLIAARHPLERLVLVDSFPFFRFGNDAIGRDVKEVVLLADLLEGTDPSLDLTPELRKAIEDVTESGDRAHRVLRDAREALVASLGRSGVSDPTAGGEIRRQRRRLQLIDYEAPTSLGAETVSLVRADRGVCALIHRMSARMTGAGGSPSYGWSDVLGVDVEVIPVSASHRTVMRAPFVGSVRRAVGAQRAGGVPEREHLAG